MANFIKETLTTERTDRGYVDRKRSGDEGNVSRTIGYLVYFLSGAIITLLSFRFVLKLLGANPSSGFVDFIYDFSGIFILPFQGIFRSGATEGVETTSVFEPATLIAIIVYAIIAWGIVRLIQIISGHRPEAE